MTTTVPADPLQTRQISRKAATRRGSRAPLPPPRVESSNQPYSTVRDRYCVETRTCRRRSAQRFPLRRRCPLLSDAPVRSRAHAFDVTSLARRIRRRPGGPIGFPLTCTCGSSLTARPGPRSAGRQHWGEKRNSVAQHSLWPYRRILNAAHGRPHLQRVRRRNSLASEAD